MTLAEWKELNPAATVVEGQNGWRAVNIREDDGNLSNLDDYKPMCIQASMIGLKPVEQKPEPTIAGTWYLP